MPDENGTEATRSDAPSADESLLGDAADDSAAPVVEEEDSNKEAEQDGKGSDDAEEKAGPPEDLKVVVSIKGGRATIGVQRTSSDPHIETFDDRDLSGLTQEVLAVVERARAKGRRTPVPGSRETRTPGQASDPAGAGVGSGRGRRGRGGPAATRDAEAVLRAGAGSLSLRPSRSSSGRPAGNRSGRRSRSARDAGAQHTGGGHRDESFGVLPLHDHLCGPFCVAGLGLSPSGSARDHVCGSFSLLPQR